ncbi:MAG TPA: hypothetical protein VFM05_06130, partial [Candidatus Saccharimonadales bacterium]|nr:hypothetical protein [Candidatus Saccharimonadales bacterium]
MAVNAYQLWPVLLLAAYACSYISLSSNPVNEIQSGRSALLAGKPEVALEHFRRVTDTDPNYVNSGSPLREGVWTYTGRAYYNLGSLNEASGALGHALARNDDDFMARLYLGLTLLRAVKVQPPENAFSQQDIAFALKERVTSTRLAALVRDRGVKFLLTPEIEKEIRKLGGDNELVQQIRLKSDAISPGETVKQQGF